MKNILSRSAALMLLAEATALAGGNRATLLPNLRPTQILTYLIRYQSDKNIKTESRVVAPMAPNADQLDAHGLLRIEVLDVQPGAKQILHARAKFLTPDSGVHHNDPEDKTVEFTIFADGSIEKVQGLDTLLPDQQQVWQEWAARFALPWTFPPDGVKLAEKWKSEQPERAQAPIAGLYWERESTYVRDEPCRATPLIATGGAPASSGPAESCAVILTTAKLKQKSSPKNATPEDFKLHDLRTTGSANGTNEIITYISLRTGLVVRATGEAKQFMDVVVTTADGSNRVHYNVDATSHSEVLLVAEPPLNQP